MKAHEHDLEFMLKSVGKLYSEGVDVKLVDGFFDCPPMQIEHTSSLPSLSPVVGWDHSKSWRVPFTADMNASSASERFSHFGDFSLMTRNTKSHVYSIDSKSDRWKGILGHQIDGRVLFPAAGYVILIAESMLEYGTCFDFHDVTFITATVVPEDGCQLMVNVLVGSGEFEICQYPSINVVCHGRVTIGSKVEELEDDKQGSCDGGSSSIKTDDVYAILRLRGYEYSDVFRSISWIQLESAGNGSHVPKCGISFPRYSQENLSMSWIAFLDCMLQFYLMAFDPSDSSLSVPIRLTKLHIQFGDMNTDADHIVTYDKRERSVTCGPNFIHDVSIAAVNRRPPNAECAVGNMELVELQAGNVVGPIMNAALDVSAKLSKNSSINVCRLLLSNQSAQQSFEKQDLDLLSSGRPYLDFDIDYRSVSLSDEPIDKVSHADIVIIGGDAPNADGDRILEENEKTFDLHSSTAVQSEPTGTPGPVYPDDHGKPNAVSCSTSGSDCAPNDSKNTQSCTRDDAKAVVDWLATHCRNAFLIALPMGNRIAEEIRSRCGQWVTLFVSEASGGSPILVAKQATGEALNHQVVRVDTDFHGSAWIDDLKSKLAQDSADRVWLVSDNQQSGLIGLLNCLAKEPRGSKLRCLLSAETNPANFALAKAADLPINIVKSDPLTQKESWFTATHRSIHTPAGGLNTDEFFELSIGQPGDLSSLSWKRSVRVIENPIKVVFAALNFRDVMLSTGRLSVSSIPGHEKFQNQNRLPLGMEFSGCYNDRRVMGLAAGGAFSSSIVDCDHRFLFEVPETWTFEQAATVPVVYATAYYALCVRAKLRSSERVLIHAGAGGVGMASIRIAQSLGCEVFTSAGSAEKRAFLAEAFNLPKDHILDSRSNAFYPAILRLTDGKGVHVVLNSLAGELLQYSVKALAENGRFLEIGKYDLQTNSSLKMAIFLRNVSFHGILLDSLFGDPTTGDWCEVRTLLRAGIKSGVVVPLRHTIYDASEVQSAFRLMAQGKHSGKILIQIREDVSGTPPRKVDVKRVLRFPANRWFLVTGGTGGLGLQLVDFLASHGATHIALTSRSGVQTGYQHYMLNRAVSRFGKLEILILKNELANEDDLLRMYQSLNESQSDSDDGLAGVFHLAGVVSDGLFEGTSEERFREVFKPKYDTLRLLDKALRDSVDYFVVFSSVAAGFGNAGQANYGMANSAADFLCVDRTEKGMYGLSVQLGPVDDVGLFARLLSAHTHSLISASISGVRSAVVPLKVSQVVQSLEQVMLDYEIGREWVGCSGVGAIYARKQLSSLQRDAFKGSQSRTIEEVLHNILGLTDLSKIDPNSKLSHLGLDSLGAVEMSQMIETHFGASISSKDLQNAQIKDLLTIGTSQQNPEPEDNDDQTALKPPPEVLTLADQPITVAKACVNGSQQIVFLLHAIEGSVDCFDHLISQFTLPATLYVLRPTKDSPGDTMSDLADYIIANMIPILASQPEDASTFSLVGYSFGCTLALQVAEKLQMQNSRGPAHIFMLDGSPVQLASVSRRYVNKQMDAAIIESMALHFFLCQAVGTATSKKSKYVLDQEKTRLAELKDSEQRQQALVSICKSVGFDAPDSGNAARQFLNRLYMSSEIDTENIYNIKCPITLIKASSTAQELGELYSDDYGLKLAVPGAKSIEFHTIECDHISLLNEDNSETVVNIIQNAMSAQI